MATNTANYNLKKPADEDFYNVKDFNDNADIIDAELAKRANKAASAASDNFAALDANGDIKDSGKKPSDFALANKMFYPNNQYGGIISTDLDAITVSGFYTCYGTATGVPNASSSWYALHINSNSGTSYGFQIAKAYGTSSGLYYRVKSADTWGEWGLCPATDIGVTDSGEHFNGATVEAVLQEIGLVLASKSNKTTIENKTEASPVLGSLANNTEYRCTNASLTTAPTMMIPAIPSVDDEFISIAIYKSPGTTAPVITNNSGYTLKYSGTDVDSNTFTPVSGTTYRLSFLFDGIYLNIYIMGVEA